MLQDGQLHPHNTAQHTEAQRLESRSNQLHA